MKNKLNLKENILLFLKGGVIGVANIIPGVSGGTLAVILGVYDKLIEAISEFFTRPKKRLEYIFFLAKIFFGAALAILFLANLMEYMLTNHFKTTIYLFMGLILGGIPVVIKAHKDMKIKITRILAFVFGMIVVLGLAALTNKFDAHASIEVVKVPLLDGKMMIMLVLSGFLAGGAMIVPGVSGSFILVLLGQYALIIALIKEMAFKPLAFLGAGVCLGILIFSKIIETCLKKIPSDTYYFILGLIVASLLVIFPGVPKELGSIAFCSAAFIPGGIVSYLLSKM